LRPITLLANAEEYTHLVGVVAINGVGQVAFNVTDNGTPSARVWKDGTATTLGPFTASAMNDAGQVVGSTGGNASRPVLWDHGTLTDLPTPDDAPGSALSINDRGQILGTTVEPDGVHYVVWNGDHVVDLGSGYGGASPRMNNRGQVVGALHQGDSQWTSVLWTLD
jgi:uncharacterized membrane protein